MAARNCRGEDDRNFIRDLLIEYRRFLENVDIFNWRGDDIGGIFFERGIYFLVIEHQFDNVWQCRLIGGKKLYLIAVANNGLPWTFFAVFKDCLHRTTPLFLKT